jgi:hypothetical protein
MRGVFVVRRLSLAPMKSGSTRKRPRPAREFVLGRPRHGFPERCNTQELIGSELHPGTGSGVGDECGKPPLSI